MIRVSSKTHTKKQLDDYANQNNPNNKAYKSRKMNEKRMKSKKRLWRNSELLLLQYPLAQYIIHK